MFYQHSVSLLAKLNILLRCALRFFVKSMQDINTFFKFSHVEDAISIANIDANLHDAWAN